MIDIVVTPEEVKNLILEAFFPDVSHYLDDFTITIKDTTGKEYSAKTAYVRVVQNR